MKRQMATSALSLSRTALHFTTHIALTDGAALSHRGDMLLTIRTVRISTEHLLQEVRTQSQRSPFTLK